MITTFFPCFYYKKRTKTQSPVCPFLRTLYKDNSRDGFSNPSLKSALFSPEEEKPKTKKSQRNTAESWRKHPPASTGKLNGNGQSKCRTDCRQAERMVKRNPLDTMNSEADRRLFLFQCVRFLQFFLLCIASVIASVLGFLQLSFLQDSSVGFACLDQALTPAFPTDFDRFCKAASGRLRRPGSG
ncbi:hypothetical protein [uncultured Allobaculum sp.]|nr:hypothetical protein [uncultured Allobaculum sp.]